MTDQQQPEPQFGKPFVLIRDTDISGVSGVGIVANGILWPDGQAVIHWTGSAYPTTTPHPSGMESVIAVHGHGGATRVVWQSIEGPPPARYGDVWQELVGYVQEAVNDGGQIDPEHLAAYMRELRHKALAPARRSTGTTSAPTPNPATTSPPASTAASTKSVTSATKVSDPTPYGPPKRSTPGTTCDNTAPEAPPTSPRTTHRHRRTHPRHPLPRPSPRRRHRTRADADGRRRPTPRTNRHTQEQHVTDRIPLDAMTSDALDTLYEQLEAAEQTESQRQLATAREALASATTRAARAEAALARVNAYATRLAAQQHGADIEADNLRRAIARDITAALDQPGPA